MKKKIISFFKKNSNTSFKSKDIAKRLKLASDDEIVSLKHFLHQLYEEKFLTRNGKRYKMNQNASSGKITGELQISPGGFGFVVPNNKKPGDIFIASRNLSTAFSGDTVEVALFAKRKGKNIEGQIVNVISRKRTNIVGTLRKSQVTYFVKPDEPEIHRDIYVDKENLKGAKEGDKVIVGNLFWDTSLLNPEGEIIEVIGKAGTKDAEISSIAYGFHFQFNFSREALERGNSVYLVGGVIPMLPEKLSNNICSLVPNKDRMTYSVIVEMTKRGKVENYQIKKTIINSKRS